MADHPVEMSSEQQAAEHLYVLGIAVERFRYVVEVAYADHDDPEQWKHHKAPYPHAVGECLGEIIQQSSLLEGILLDSDFANAKAIATSATSMRQLLHDVWMDHAHMSRLRHREESLDAAETSESELNWEALFGSPFHVQGWAKYEKTIDTFASGLTPLFQVRFLLGRTQAEKQFPRPSSYDPQIGTLPGFDPAYVQGVLDTKIKKLEIQQQKLIEASLQECDSIGQPDADLESGAPSSNSQRGYPAGGSQPQSAIAAAINPDSSGELVNPKRRRSQADTDTLVREYLKRHASNDPESITVDAIVTATGSSKGAVAQSSSWRVFHAARLARKEPKAPRTVPLSPSMLAMMPDGNASDPGADAELDLLIKEQQEEHDRDERKPRPRS